MKKIKGSLKAIRMSHLVVMFAVMAVACMAIRTHQLLNVLNLTNGFFENSDFTVPVLYGILAVGSVLFLILSFLSKNVPSPKLTEGRNIPLGIASFIGAIGFVWDIIVIAKTVVPVSDTPYGINTNVFDMLMNNYIKDNGGVFLILQFVFAVLSVFYLIVFGMSHFEGKATYKKISLLSIAPGCWAMFVLISKLMKAVSFITVSELLFEIGMLVFTMLFFLTFARIVSGVFSVNSMWCTYGCGFPAAIFAGLISVSRGISLVVGNGTVEGNDFSFTYLFLFIFIVVYILSTLGAGFKNSLKKMQSVSKIVLPDDAEVVVKHSSAPLDASEVQETEKLENIEKKKRFSIAPEFKNMGGLDNFFDEEPEYDITEEVENTSEYEFTADEISTEKTDDLPVDEAAEETTEIEEINEVEETEKVEEISSFDTSIPVEDIAFYQLEDLVNKTEVENTVGAEAVEHYEEKVDEETDEDCDEVDSQIDDSVTFEENSQEVDTTPIEEVTEISFDAYGEDIAEENTEEISQENTEENIEESGEEINGFDDEFDVELTAIFAQNEESDKTYDTAEEVISETVEEFGLLDSFEETVEEAEVTGTLGEAVEIVEAVESLEEIVEEVSLLDETELLSSGEQENSSVKSNDGFLEFSQMLIEDFDDEVSADDIVNEEKADKPSAEVVEAAETEEPKKSKSDKAKKEKVKKEKVKKDKVKKEKVKKDKVKKEKPQKAPKSFGKKKKKEEDEEPLKIVSLADLKNKKD